MPIAEIICFLSKPPADGALPHTLQGAGPGLHPGAPLTRQAGRERPLRTELAHGLNCFNNNYDGSDGHYRSVSMHFIWKSQDRILSF